MRKRYTAEMHPHRTHPVFLVILLACIALPGSLALWQIHRETSSLILPSHTAVIRKLARQSVTAQMSVRGIAFGDIMLDRYVATLMQRYNDDYPFRKIQPLLSDHDVVIANLEGPIVDVYRQTADNALRFSFPRTSAALLKAQGWTALSLANNHMLDHGEDGYTSTRLALREAGASTFGNPTRIDRADTVTTTSKSRTIILVGFLATHESFPAQQAIDLIRDLANNTQSFVVVSVHWGSEYQTHSNAFQQQLGHAFIDAGADLVLGHHPHVVQEIEIYHHRPIFYSLGNLIFDQYFSAETQHMLGIDFTLEDGNIRYDILPLVSTKSQPRLMESDAATRFLQDLASRSRWEHSRQRADTSGFTLPWSDETTK